MTIRDQLLKVEFNSDRDVIAKGIGADTEKFDTLIQLTLTEKPKFVLRIFLVVNRVLDRHPTLFLPYVGIMIEQLEKKNVHVAYKRNIMRALQDVEIPKEFEGRALDLAMLYLYDLKEAIAVKAFALRVAFNLSTEYPELLTELRLIITEMLPHAKPGIISRGRKIMGEIDALLNERS